MDERLGVSWQSKLPGLVEAIHREEFPQLCLEAIKTISDFDSAVIMAYGIGPRPKILFDYLSDHYRDAFYQRYLKGAFLLSPLYQAYKDNAQGFYPIKDVAPEGFFESDYYKKYYCYSGLIDQVFYLKQFGDGVAIMVSIARTKKLTPYSDDEIYKLKEIEPILLSLLSKQWEMLATDTYSFSDYLNKAFENFACSVLSKREKDAVNCMLRGSSSKSAAKQMGISTETERSYRKSIYNKLNVSSHSEIYNLFFQALEFADNSVNTDPLVVYWESIK